MLRQFTYYEPRIKLRILRVMGQSSSVLTLPGQLVLLILTWRKYIKWATIAGDRPVSHQHAAAWSTTVPLLPVHAHLREGPAREGRGR